MIISLPVQLFDGSLDYLIDVIDELGLEKTTPLVKRFKTDKTDNSKTKGFKKLKKSVRQIKIQDKVSDSSSILTEELHFEEIAEEWNYETEMAYSLLELHESIQEEYDDCECDDCECDDEDLSYYHLSRIYH